MEPLTPSELRHAPVLECSGVRAAPLDDRVGGKRRAMNEHVQMLARVAEHAPCAVQHALFGRAPCGCAARSKFAPAYEYPERVSHETFRTYLEPVFGTSAAIRNIQRYITSLGRRDMVAIEPLLRQLRAPTLVVWGTDDVYFSVKWAYWLRDTIPGCRKVIELAGARLFFPEERPEELAQALREHWQEFVTQPVCVTALQPHA